MITCTHLLFVIPTEASLPFLPVIPTEASLRAKRRDLGDYGLVPLPSRLKALTPRPSPCARERGAVARGLVPRPPMSPVRSPSPTVGRGAGGEGRSPGVNRCNISGDLY